MNEKIRVRLGVKTSSFWFPNAGIVVVYMTEDQYGKALGAAYVLQDLLHSVAPSLRFVCEKS